MRADTELFKDKIEVSLDGRQIFYLFFGGAVIASLVFVLGVMVGKRVEARAHVDSRPATSAAQDPLAALDELVHREDLAFASALSGETDEPLGEVDQVLALQPAPLRPAAQPVNHKDSHAKETAAKPAAHAKSDEVAHAKADSTKAAAPADKSADKQAAKEPGKSESDKKAKFTLQLSSFQARTEADAFVQKLRAAGYSPHLIEAEVEDKTWYRVRLGNYESFDAAVEAKAEFEKKQQIIAYVTRLSK